jgi:hypothetical protein
MHSNKSLPPVGIPVKVKMEDGTWLPIKRDHWLTNKDDELSLRKLGNCHNKKGEYRMDLSLDVYLILVHHLTFNTPEHWEEIIDYGYYSIRNKFKRLLLRG